LLFLALTTLEPYRSILPRETGDHIIDGSAYDILFGTVCGGLGVALSLFFAAITTALIVVKDRSEQSVTKISGELYTTGYLIAPFVFLETSLLLLGSHAFGARTYHWALPAYLLLGVASTISFARLGQLVYGVFSLQTSTTDLDLKRQAEKTRRALLLGSLHTEVWRAHDTTDFEGLARSASRLYVELGYEPVRADEAAECLALAYRLADDAEEAQISHDGRREVISYKEAATLLMSNRRLLNRPRFSGLLEAF
jgi:hypothetical protein